MAGGNSDIESSNNLINENDDDEGTKSSFADARNDSDSNRPKQNTCMLAVYSSAIYIVYFCSLFEINV